jgi:hypothetical protein
MILRIIGKASDRWGELDESTLYAYIEISQWNSFVQLIYANKKWKIYTLCPTNTEIGKE